MSKISPCLWYAREAEEAANFYISLVPDSRINHVQRNLVENPSGKPGTVLLVDFTVGGQRFLALNGDQKMQHTYAVSFFIECDDQAEVDRLWDGLIAGGGKHEHCGWLQDRWGVYWQVVPRLLPRLLADPDQAKASRVMQAMMGMIKLDIAGLQAAYDGA
jgi:predicted 3-demethylubiquinone-9 3-methyltransferase (glyoxalase superfamily)